eukprot:c15656_g1_i1 orf=177-752(+)
MALLAKKLSFLPFMGLKATHAFMATYVSISPAAVCRQNANQTAAVNDEGDSMTYDDGEVMNVDQDAVLTVADDGSDVFESVPCRVSSPPARRPWATSQDETAVRFRMDMPGVSKDDVKIYLDDDRLVVRGKYAQLKEEALDEDHVLADNVGVYKAEILLPENVQKEKIKSEMKDGILLVTAPKEVTFIPVD